MAGEPVTDDPTSDERLRGGRSLRVRQLKERAFEAVLVGATLLGIVSLLALFVQIAVDAMGLDAAAPGWYLLYFGTLVTPTAAFALYVRRHGAARTASARAFAVVCGGTVGALLLYVVAQALSPYDVLVYAIFAAVPPLVVAAYGRTRGDERYVGPAIPLAVLVGVLSAAGLGPVLRPVVAVGLDLLEPLVGLSLSPTPFVYAVGVSGTVAVGLGIQRTLDSDEGTAPAVLVAALVGLVVTEGLYGYLRPVVGIAAAWIAYFVFATLPVAAALGLAATRSGTVRRGRLVATAVVGGGLAAGAAGIATGANPSLLVVFMSVLVAPTAYVFWRTLETTPEGRLGLLGPFVVAGGILTGAVIERRLGVAGLDGYLTPTLLSSSWDGLTASNAGVYPQLVGSILIVGFMALMAFPVGTGAAIYLEEYAPATGLFGRLATLLEVNISNLAGVPSVVYGILGLALFRNVLGLGPGLVVSAAATLGLLILPIVIVSAQEALRSVPDSLRDASYGMGASRWQTLRNVVLPEAVPGILTGTILALGRAIGETAPLVIIGVATTTYSAPEGLFSSATALPLQIFASASNAKPEFRTGVVAATAVVLLVLMLTMNAVAIVVRNRYENNDTPE